MDYTVDRDMLFPLIDEEVSRVANETYSDDGTSLYDNIRITSADHDTIDRLEDDAVNTFVKRVQDICTLSAEHTAEDEDGEEVVIPAVLSFYVPDFDLSLTEITAREITRYIVLNTCAAWFQARCKDKVQEYADRSQVAMDKAVAYLKTIKLHDRRRR